MPILKNRNRLVSFRVTTEEYDHLRALCVTKGARSISEFARNAVLLEAEGGRQISIGEDLATLGSQLRHLDKSLVSLRERIAKVIGPASRAGGTGS